MKCDLCGKKVGASYELVCLLDSYKTDDIEWICGSCEQEVNKVLNKMRSASNSWYLKIFKQFLINKKDEYVRK